MMPFKIIYKKRSDVSIISVPLFDRYRRNIKRNHVYTLVYFIERYVIIQGRGSDITEIKNYNLKSSL